MDRMEFGPFGCSIQGLFELWMCTCKPTRGSGGLGIVSALWAGPGCSRIGNSLQWPSFGLSMIYLLVGLMISFGRDGVGTHGAHSPWFVCIRFHNQGISA